MNDDELRHAYGSLRDQRRRASEGPGAAPRPAPEAIWSALAGELEPGERVRILDDALRAGASDEVALMHTMRSAAVSAAEPASVPQTPLSGRRWWPMAVAAALLVTVSVPLLRNAGERAAPSTGAPVRFREAGTTALQLAAPASDAPLSDSVVFVWHPVAEARDYALEAIDAEGRIVARVITTDSATALPATMSAAERARITGWWVTATSRDGAQVRSDLRLVAPAQRP